MRDDFQRWIGLPLRGLAPNRIAAWTIILATALETVLLTLVPGHIFECPGPTRIQVPLYLFGFWYVTVWAVWWLTAAVSRRTAEPSLLRKIASTVLYVAVLGGLLLHAAGWAMYLSTGQFGTVDALEFMLRNSGESWMVEYLWQSEKWYVFGAVASTAAVALLLPYYLRRLRDGRWNESRSLTPRRTRLLRLSACLLLVIAWSTVGEVRRADSSVIRRGQWNDALQRRLSPAVSLALSTVRRTLSEPIEPALDERRLTPRTVTAASVAVATPKPASVIFVAIESLRHDVVNLRHQDREVTPNLNRLAKQGVHFTRAYTQSTHSDYADVCIVSSLYPLRKTRHHYYSANDPWPKTLVYDLLKPLGYSTAIFSSQNEKWGCMDQFFASPNLDVYHDAEQGAAHTRIDMRDSGFAREVASGALRSGTLDDSYTTDRAIEWIESQVRADRPFFLNMNFQSSHFPYTMAPDVPRPFQPADMDFDAGFLYYPQEKIPVVRNAYYNAVHECDRQLGRLVDTLAKSGALDDTILVVMGENGESFYENGVVSHAGRPAEPTIHVALVMHSPRLLKPQVEDYPTELVDVAPTVLSLLQQPSHPNFQGRNVCAEDRPAVEDRLLFFHVENPVARCDALLYQGRWKLIRDRNRNVDELFDLSNDPTESRNLLAAETKLAAKLSAALTEWRRGQLAYYHYPQYFLRYYPPPPPIVQ